MANSESPISQTDAAAAFAQWLKEHPELTQNDTTDIAKQIKDLRAGKTPEQLAPKTTGGRTFTRWVILAPKNAQALIQDPNNWLMRLNELPNPPDPPILTKVKNVAAAVEKIEQQPTAPAVKPAVAPSLIIARTPYPKWWKTLCTAAISLSGAGTQIVVPTPGKFILFIATIVLTVSDETNISFTFGVFGSSGSLDLGGTDEPRGIVIAMGDSPAPCGKGGFTVTSDGAGVAVGGFVTYYLETET
jgi:hypothetical protein